MKIKNLKLGKKIALITGTVVLSTSLLLSGCDAQVYNSNIEDEYDVIDSQGEDVRILPQVLDVPGEDFKLIIEYSLDENTSKKWTITDNKKIFTRVYTEGLADDVKVWIDNVHTDTSIVSTRETMNGILQDTMDDHIHNSLMYGFPISDTTSYYAVNEIEGQNDSFISGSFFGFNGYASGIIDERRYTEEDYLGAGVYANKISSSYGILIQKGDAEPYGVDVSSDIVVLACNTIERNYESGRKDIRVYNRDGSYSLVTSDSEKVKKITD